MKELLEWLLKQRTDAKVRRSQAYTRIEEAFSDGEISILSQVIGHVRFLTEEEKGR